MENVTKCTPSQAGAVIEGVQGEIPVMVFGPPGVGKSSEIAAVAKRNNLAFIDTRLTLMQASDIRGLPVPDMQKKITRWLKIEDFPTDEMIAELGVDGILWLFDELTSATPSVQVASQQILLDRAIGQHKLPGRWEDGPNKGKQKVWLVAAGNQATDKAVHYKLPSPVADRMICLTVETTPDSWRSWATQNNIHPLVIGFHAFQGGRLLAPKIDPNDSGYAFPTPRGWNFVSNMLYKLQGASDEVRSFTFEGIVGPGAAGEFKAFCKVEKNLPDVQKMLEDRKMAIEIPKDASVLHVMSSALGQYVNDKNIDRFLDIVNELPKEYGVLAFGDAVRRKVRAVYTHEKSKKFQKELAPYINI